MSFSKLKLYFWNALFCIAVIIFFGTITVLRPPATGAIYKEFLTGVVVLCIFYINRYGFYPRFYLKGKIRQYLFCTLLSMVVAAALEYVLIYPQLANILSTTTSVLEARLSCIVYFLLILCRDAVVCLLSSLLCNYSYLKQLKEVLEYRLRENNDELLAYSHGISIRNTNDNTPTNTQHTASCNLTENVGPLNQLTNAMVFFDVKELLYFEQFKSNTLMYTVNDKILIRNSTLTKTILLVGEENVIRVSKSVVVMKTYVKSSDDQNIYLFNPTNAHNIKLKWSEKYKKKALPILEQILVEEHTAQDSQDLSEKLQERNTSALLQKKKVSKVYFYICDHPMCKASKLSKELGLSSATANRILKQLRSEGLITYEGSKKTGGYSVVSS